MTLLAFDQVGQIIIVLIMKGYIGSEIAAAFWELFNPHRLLLWYLIAINVAPLIAFAVDKINAIESKPRMRIALPLG